jgi:hypothetical protein
MTPSEAATVLTFAAAFDRRTVGETDARAWSMALPNVALDEAQAAIVEHYRESRDFMMPSDVLRIVRRIRGVRATMLPDVVPPSELADEPRREIEWKRVWGDAFIAGHTDGEARAIANRRFDIAEEEPLALDAIPSGSLRDALDRAERGRLDAERLAAIKAEVARREAQKAREVAPVDEVLARHAPDQHEGRKTA